MDIKKIEKRRQSIENSEEWQNFTTFNNSIRELFAPDHATLRTQVSKGTKIGKRRVSDIGIKMKSDITAGILSEMITSGDQWFEYTSDLMDNTGLEMLDGITKISYDRINNCNFHSEQRTVIESGVVDGTVCEYVEREGKRLIYKSVPFGNFWFTEDFYGRPDTVWVCKTTTVGALIGKYGLEGVSDKTRQCFEKDPDKEISIVMYCAPRFERNKSKSVKDKAYELLVYEKDEKHLLEEGGVDFQKFIIYRFKKIGMERLGRGPCADTICTMRVIERAEKDLEREASIKTRPFFAIPASQGGNSYQIIHDEDASFMIWNDIGMGNAPQQLLSAADVQTGIEYIQFKMQGMHAQFFLDYFNPLADRRNMTLGEAKERVQKAHQMVDNIVGPLIEELFNPLLKWTMVLLGEGGEFKDFGSWDEIQSKLVGVKIRYKSRLANVQKRIRLMASMEAMQYSMMIAQGIPDPVLQYEFLARFRTDLLPEEIIEGTNAPKFLLRDRRESKQMAQQFADGLAQQQKMDNTVKMADAASKGGSAPQPGSLTSMVLGGQ